MLSRYSIVREILRKPTVQIAWERGTMMPKPNKKSYYSRLPQTLKSHSKRIATLRQQVQEMKHYWKIRCKERHTLTKELLRIKNLLNRMEHLEKTFTETLGRKAVTIRGLEQHKTKNQTQRYPIFMSTNNAARLNWLLKNNIRYRYVTRKQGKSIPWLNKNELYRLKTLLKK